MGNAVEAMMDAYCKAMGDFALRKRRLIVDYKDHSGRDFHQDLVTWHDRRATDEALVQSVRESLAGKGYTLTALGEVLGDGSTKVLYLAPGYMEESLQEMGLKVPTDMTAAMSAAGIHPVNWEELTHGG